MSKPRAVRLKEEVSQDLAALLKHQNEIKEWQAAVNRRVQSMEEAYLRETAMGNIVRGFDQDASNATFKNRNKADTREVDEKEKLFSGSSFPIFDARQKAAAAKAAAAKAAASKAASSGPATKKAKKS